MMSRKGGRPLPPTPPEYRDNGGYEVPVNRRVSHTNEDNPYDSITDIDRRMVVRKLPRSVSEETIQLYFESKRHQGREMVVEKVDLYAEQDEAIVTFETAEDVNYVLERHKRTPCKLQKQTLVVELFEEAEGDTIDEGSSPISSQDYSDMYETASVKHHDETDTIEARGFSESCSEDTLRFYFENTRRSGGGDIKSFTMNRDKGFAHITFQDRSVVKNVVGRKHQVDKSDLDVHPFIISKKDLLLDEVPYALTEEHVANFLEAKLKAIAISVVFNVDKSKALVQFKNEFDFSKAREICGKYKVGGEYVVPVQVPVTNSIVVTNIPEDVTRDAVEVYFENTRRSKGGDTVKVELHIDEGYCLVFFKDPKVVPSVCEKKDHKLHSRPVNVQPYNEYFGLPNGCEVLAFKLPESISLRNQNPYKMKFLKKNATQKAALEKELLKCNAEIVWDEDPIVVECTLSKDVKSHRKLLKTWNETAQDVIDQFTDVLKVKDMNVNSELWDDTMTELGRLQLSHPDAVALVVEKVNRKIILVAHKGLADDVWGQVSETVKIAEKQHKERKETVNEEKVLDDWKIKYLKSAGFRNEMCDEYENLKLDFEEKKGKGKIILTGPKLTVHNVWITMYERLQNIRRRDVDIGEKNAQLLQNENTKEKLRQKMKKQHVSDVMEIKRDTVVLYADDEDDLTKMESAVNKMFAKLCFNLDSGTESVLKSSEWKNTEKTLHDKFSGCLIIDVNSGQIEIFTLADIQNRVSAEFQGFLSKNAVYKEQMTLSPHIVIFVKRVLRSQFERELQTLKGRGLNITITLDDKKGAVSLEGTSDGMKEGKELIQKLKKGIQTEQHTLKHRKIKSYLACSQGQDCVKKVQDNTPCVIDMEGSGFKKSFHGKMPAMSTFDKPTLCAEASLKHGVKLSVYGGDITALDVEVLVNAANKELKHAGGLAAVIVNKGGKEIQSECDGRVRNKGPLSDGKVYMSGAGKLQCKGIAHAVGPHWRGGGDGEEMCLQTAVFTCLEKTEKRNFKSIAMPALSAGMFHYPVDMSCMAIVKAVDQHFKSNRSCIKEVVLCDISQSTVSAFATAVQNVVPNTKVHVNLGQGDGPKPSWLINTDDDKRNAAAGGHMKVGLVKAELAKEKVDVIVNSAAPDLQLRRGASSNAILKAAGDRIQQECDQNYPNGIQVGEVAVTSAGKLKCTKVFHIAIKHYDRDNRRECLKGVGQCVKACLEEADQIGLKSISFPAMGTGAQRYPRDMVAKEMFKTISTFFKDNPGSSLKTVRLVIYTEDDETFEAFITEEKNWVGDTSHHRQPSAGRRVAKTGIGKLTKESRGKASFLIGKLKMEIYEGDITEEDAMAIVASCNMDLDLSKGAVTKALLRKGGNAIEQDCKQQKDTMKKDGIAITTAGKLRSKYIIHVDTKYKTWEWKPVVLSCLKIAEKHKFASVAFPALGTSVGCKPEAIADVVASAIGDFLRDNPSHLQEIRMVIFKKDMVPDFIDGMKNSVQGQTGSGDSNADDKQRQHNRQSGSRHQHKAPKDEAEDSCTITIYAESTEKIRRAKSVFDKIVKDEWHIKKIEDQGIHRLSSKNIDEIKKMAKNYHVEVHVDTDVGTIEVIGLVANVINVNDVIHNQLRSADMSFYMKGHAQLMSNIVRWIYLKDQKEYPFPDKINLEIENAYRKKDKNVKIKDRSGGEYEIDFVNMEEHDVKQPNKKFPIIRRDLIAGASLDIPKKWRTMNDKENLAVVTLDPNSQEHSNVVTEFKQTLNANPTIVRVERIQNKTLYTQYSAKRKEMNNNNPKKKDNERVLWHGTADDAVQSINSHGFNRSYCGKNATAFGMGVYFAVQSAYSNQSTYSPPGRDGNKRMYRCLVLTGKYCTGNGGMRVPPAVDQSKPHILYDSVTNNTSSPSMFVIFNDTQAYPEHLIVYK
ncbi:protein mono-ADP-ribosyltransferase PARP14-like [Mercenaria mercenaria]|uniref:protein mono-ADP-ribosyltransferase PARP14-like n=1 Tax=Mercenaria mercenaria TaxID=6596 RepID=UPI00234EE357|nr:protein mono-ADP-ribosyltransferase PARP14-like [Mercenaria mercenaria]